MKNYRGLWCLLAVALAVITALSIYHPVRLLGWELRDSGIARVLSDTSYRALNVVVEPVAADSMFDHAVAVVPVEVDTLPKTLLFIGDSMLEGLSPRLAAYAKHNGHTLYSVIWYSSTTEVWGRSGKLKGYIDRLHPDFIFISLGANELFVSDIITKRDKYVKTLLAEIGDIPYLWIGPPNWKPDTGINRMISDNVPAGEFFLSDGMHFDRAKDGAHPTRSSAVEWMDSVVRWMNVNSPHPFRMDLPPTTTASAARIFVHQPDER